MSEHAWVLENAAAHCAGGLKAEEVERLEKHTAKCQACADLVAEFRALDQRLDDLFAGVRPPSGFENRVIQKLRTAPTPRRRRWVIAVRWAAAVAALVLLGVIGACVQRFVEDENLPFLANRPAGGERTQAQNELKKIPMNAHVPDGGTVLLGGLSKDSKEDPGGVQNDNSIDFFPPAFGLVVRSPSGIHSNLTGGVIGGKLKRVEDALLYADVDQEKLKSHKFNVKVQEYQDAGKQAGGQNGVSNADGLAFSPDGRQPAKAQLATDWSYGFTAGTDLLWDTKTGKVHTKIRDGTSNTVRIFDVTTSVKKDKAEEASKRNEA